MTSELEALSASSVSRRTPASTDPAPPGDVEVSVPVTTPMGSIYAIDGPPVNVRAAAARGPRAWPGRPGERTPIAPAGAGSMKGQQRRGGGVRAFAGRNEAHAHAGLEGPVAVAASRGEGHL